MKRYILVGAADDDLTEIVDFIRRESGARAARRVLGEIRSAMRRLAQMPEIGHLRSDLAQDPVRFWAVYSYLIVYRPETRPLEIVRVLHGARDVRAILDDVDS